MLQPVLPNDCLEGNIETYIDSIRLSISIKLFFPYCVVYTTQ